MLKNGAVEFYDIKQDSRICDFAENIPFNEYLYDEKLPDGYISIADFGASPDADYEINTRAINAAITNVSENGGGTVFIPEGIFLTSTVLIKSDVTLFVKGTLKCIDWETNKNAANKLTELDYSVASRVRNVNGRPRDNIINEGDRISCYNVTAE